MAKKVQSKSTQRMAWAPENLLEAIYDGVCVIDKEMRITYANESYRRAYGRDLVGKLCYEAFRGNNQVCSGCPVVECFATGEPSSSQMVRCADGRSRSFFDKKASPLRNDEGETIAAVVVSRDITEQKLIEQEADRRGREIVALAEVAMALNQSIEMGEVLDIAIRQAVEVTGALGGAIRLLDESGERLIWKSFYTKSKEPVTEEMMASQTVGVGPMGKAAADKTIILVGDIGQELGGAKPDHSQSLTGVRISSIAVVPLLSRDKLLGTMALGSEEKNNFTEANRGLLKAIGSQVAMCIENAELLEKARQDAATIKMTILDQLKKQVSELENTIGKYNVEKDRGRSS